jgi:hypothetical protein
MGSGEGRREKEEGRREKGEGRRKKEEGRSRIGYSPFSPLPSPRY